MKKYGFITFVAFLGLFLVCSCGKSDKAVNDGYMAFFNEYENVLNEAVVKIKDAKSEKALDEIDAWLESRLDAIEERMDIYEENHSSEVNEIYGQIDNCEGVYYNKLVKLEALEDKCDELFYKRLKELDVEW